jgi:hypothetical protein
MSNLRTISDFKSKLTGGGARPNLFEVSIPSFPDAVKEFWGGTGAEAEIFNFLCKSAALPASNITPIDIPFRGRTLKVAGDRTFDPWTVTIINDEDFRLRTAFEKWMNLINKLENSTGATNPNSYMVDAYVHQLGRGKTKNSTDNYGNSAINNGNLTPLRTYKFYQIFPTNVSQIDLSYDTADDIETYTVEFQILYWTAGESNTSSGDQAGSSSVIK